MNARTLLSVTALALIGFFLLSGDPGLTTIGPVGAMAGYAVGDALLKQTLALPNGAAATTSSAIDLAHGTNGGNFTDTEFLLEAPALNATQLPNSKTMTYAVVTSANSDLSSPTVVNSSLLVQTGAGGVGAVAASARFRLPSDCQRYVGVKATGSATGDASGASATLSLKF